MGLLHTQLALQLGEEEGWAGAVAHALKEQGACRGLDTLFVPPFVTQGQQTHSSEGETCGFVFEATFLFVLLAGPSALKVA